MEQFVCPVDVISVCRADGEIRPLRLQLKNAEQMNYRVDIEEVLSVKEIPYVGVEAKIFMCRAVIHGRECMIELKYSIRTHNWTLLGKVYG